jgi:hypothetical protein
LITKVHQSRNLGPTMRYVYQEYKGAEVVDTSCMRVDLEGAQAEIMDAMSERPEIKKPVFHAILSVPAGDEVTPQKWQEIASEYTERMGFGAAPYVAVAHHDTEHHHIHIVASRVDVTGKLVSDSFEKYRSQEIARDLEIKHGLTRVPSSWEVPERAPTRGEYHELERTGQQSVRGHLKEAIGQELERHERAPELAEALARRDIKLVPKVTQNGGKVVGVYFEHEGRRIPGSKVSRDYSWPKLSRQLGYDHQRDFSRLSRAPEHDVPRHTTGAASTPSERAKTTPPTREIIRNSPTRRAPSERTEHTATSRRGPDKTLRRVPRQIERPRAPGGDEAAPSPAPSTKIEAPPREVSKTPQGRAQAHPEYAASAQDMSRSRVTSEQAKAQMKRALERAEYARGWRAWAESVRAQGVEPIPKGTQTDSTKVRGMYFEAGGHTVPGSQVGRAYSIKGLEARIGAYEPSRDARAFTHVEVPGRGREVMPKAPPETVHTVPSSAGTARAPRAQEEATRTPPLTPDTLTPLLVQLRARNAEVVREPGHFSGAYVGTYQDAEGARHAAILRGNSVALVRLGRGEHVIEAVRGDRGEVVPQRVLTSSSELGMNQHVEWRDEGARKALIKVEPAREREVESPTRTVTNTEPTVRTRTPPVTNTPTPTTPTAPTKPSLEEWSRARAARGERVREIAPRETVRGTLESRKIALAEGNFHVLKTPGGSTVLIKESPELERLQGSSTTSVSVRLRTDGSLAVKDLKQTRDHDR